MKYHMVLRYPIDPRKDGGYREWGLLGHLKQMAESPWYPAEVSSTRDRKLSSRRFSVSPSYPKALLKENW